MQYNHRRGRLHAISTLKPNIGWHHSGAFENFAVSYNPSALTPGAAAATISKVAYTFAASSYAAILLKQY